MGIRKLKPTTPGQRHKIIGAFDKITASTPEKSLVVGKKSTGGRNNTGKMTMRYIGGGHKQKYRIIDFKRNKKIPAQKLISFLVSQGSSSTRVEMLDFWGLDSSIPTASALSQQRAKLKPDALEAVFRHFNSSSMELPPASFKDPHYRFLAADGSTCTFFSTPAFSSPDYYCCPARCFGWNKKCLYR